MGRRRSLASRDVELKLLGPSRKLTSVVRAARRPNYDFSRVQVGLVDILHFFKLAEGEIQVGCTSSWFHWRQYPPAGIGRAASTILHGGC